MKKIKYLLTICCLFILSACSVLNPVTPEPTLAVVNQNPPAKLIVEGKLVPEKVYQNCGIGEWKELKKYSFLKTRSSTRMRL